jgi:hypothetical protein
MIFATAAQTKMELVTPHLNARLVVAPQVEPVPMAMVFAVSLHSAAAV